MEKLVNIAVNIYVYCMVSIVVFGIIRIAIGIAQGEFRNISFYQY